MQQVIVNDYEWDFVSVERVNGVNIGISNDTAKVYYVDNRYHREDGPAIEWFDGTKAWYINGKLHREDGPAIERINGYKAWYLNGQRHREDGPAVICCDGRVEYWLNGVQQDVNPICKTKRSK